MSSLGYALAASVLAAGTVFCIDASAGQNTADELFANAALHSLHELARSVAQYGQATKDGDQLGCHYAYVIIPQVAHDALTNMHSMSFATIDAIKDVSTLLRVSQLELDECPVSGDFMIRQMFTIAGQAIMALRYDYSIGNGDWYTANPDGTIGTKNPLQYAESLDDQRYSWVSVRPKDMVIMIEPDWKAELTSTEVDDPSIENSGNNLKAIELDYRKNPDNSNTYAYFYRTKEDAASDPRVHRADWKKKLASLPYVTEDHDAGFKLVYHDCKDTGKRSADGGGICAYDASHDWSDTPGVPYHWFSDFQSCGDAARKIYLDEVKIGSKDAFVSDCVPASKVHGQVPMGYAIVFALVAPGAEGDEPLYAQFRQIGSATPAVFKTFKACYEGIDNAYHEIPKDLGVDEDGNLLSNKAESIEFTATCVRVY